MRIGVAFPTTEIGNRPDDVRRFATTAESIGFDYLTCIDHVIQGRAADPSEAWRAYYTRDNPFHEVLVLFGFLAAVTRRVELASAILILPQRPTVLVAKQLAEIDVLSEGRLRVGIGLGWNALEFDALGQAFGNRAERMAEQIEVLRLLWSHELVDFEGRYHRISDAGLNPLPVQRPIPIWFGAFVPRAIRRAGRLGDGLFLNPRVPPGERAREEIALFRDAAAAAGRDPDALGLDVTLFTEDRGANALREAFEAWRALGATHVTLRTMTAGHPDVSAHLDALSAAYEAVTG